ncbi:unnamed protein product [Parnassius apollo]|uniref:(apollo) hypothetical protein n=1 Tax=Parnassius apollo TaxID=110799 RepID=A0A8S3XZP0_PARAO|nr:unnamed protein product [Parnassius apollo]
MNKFLIVLLAICLVSVHAFVKRDTEPVANEISWEKIQKDFQDMANTINEKVKETLNPEQVKKSFNEAVDNLHKAIQELQAKTEAPKN